MTSQPVRIGVVAVILREDRFLVIRRSQSVIAPGLYCFPGGGIEQGETQPQTLVREIQEELGQDVKPVRKIWESMTAWRVQLHWWRAEMIGDTLLANPAEVESFHWWTEKETRAQSDLLESTLEFLDALQRGECRLD